MKTALCVFPIQHEMPAALELMKDYIFSAAELGADLLVFPETCLLGLEILGELSRDRELCLDEDSADFEQIRAWTKEARINLCFGFLEYDRGRIYDSAICLDREGKTLTKYRRISIGWMIPGVDEEHYCRGQELPTWSIEGCRTGILICGDLCEEDLISKLEAQNLDLCLHIMARSFPISDEIESLWLRDELPEYILEWKRLARVTLCINSVSTDLFRDETDYCGGAWVVNKSGQVLASKPLLERGLLIYELEN